MIKNILAVAIVVSLGACSSSSNNDTAADQGTGEPTGGGEVTDGGGTGTPGTGVVDAPGGGEGPITETKAGSYVGTFGFANGVYVIDNDNRFSGLAINADGRAQSLFGQIDGDGAFSGSLRQYIHEQSRLNDAAISFGSTGGAAGDLSIDVNIVNGQTIESTAESSTAVALLGSTGSELSPASASTLAGTWSGANSFCNVADGAPVAGTCNTLTTELTFSGTAVTGSTTFVAANAAAGDAPFVAPISGAITDFGDVALINFSWNNVAGFSGLVSFTLDGNGDIAFVGENLANPDNVTISGRLRKQ